MTAWFIDALNASGGSAFAAFRTPDLAFDDQNLSSPAIFLTAPEFAPTPVSSRSIGMAAARGRFQSGLFLDGAEVGFARLDDLVTFVRRVYLGRGGGPNAPRSEAEGGPFGPPAGETDRGGPADDPDEESTKSLMEFGLTFLDAAHQSEKKGGPPSDDPFAATTPARAEHAYVVSTTRIDRLSATSVDPTSTLADSISTIAVELARRGPASSSREGLREWRSAIARLGRATRRLGLTNLMFDSHQLPEHMASETPSHAQHTISARYPDDLENHYRKLLRWGWTRESDDTGLRFDDLRLWPLPPTYAHWASDPYRATVSDLLGQTLSDPRILYTLGWTEARVLVFAAAHLQPVTSVHDPGIRDTQSDELVEHVDRALAWLSSQLPVDAFPTPVEDLIAPPRYLQRAGDVRA